MFKQPTVFAPTVAEARERAARVLFYLDLREKHPEVAVRHLWAYACGAGDGESLPEYLCSVTTGHKWAYTGSAYGGDDDRWLGEGRCYCSRCGKDGDA